MVSFLLLCLVVSFGVSYGQNLRECYNCNLEWFSQCWFTRSYSTICQDDTYNCGRTRYMLGTTNAYSIYGCVASGDCNKTGIATGQMRVFNYNTTCCIWNYCNGSAAVRAPHVAFLAAICLFLFYIVS